MLEISHLSVSYGDDSLVLQDISLRIDSREKVAILGPSGCGKTTLLNAISDTLVPEAKITGTIKKADMLVSVVFQTPCLLPWKTVYENICFACGKIAPDRQKIVDLIRLVGLEGHEHSHPHELSLGMQQRVNFVRALAVNPDLILLDEPFSALDEDTKDAVISTFKHVLEQKKISCLIVTHDMDEAERIADTIVRLTPKPTSIKETLTPGKKASY